MRPPSLRMKPSLRLRAAAAALAALALVLAAPALAQRLSDRTIFIVVPFTPGTGIDVLARIVGEELRQRWNQPVVIENKPGASGNIGTQGAARAEPDGHTIMMTVNTFVMNASLYKSLPYDPVQSFDADRRGRDRGAGARGAPLRAGEVRAGADRRGEGYAGR